MSMSDSSDSTEERQKLTVIYADMVGYSFDKRSSTRRE